MANKVEEVYTFEEIADILGGPQGYNENLNEKTVGIIKRTCARYGYISFRIRCSIGGGRQQVNEALDNTPDLTPSQVRLTMLRYFTIQNQRFKSGIFKQK